VLVLVLPSEQSTCGPCCETVGNCPLQGRTTAETQSQDVSLHGTDPFSGCPCIPISAHSLDLDIVCEGEGVHMDPAKQRKHRGERDTTMKVAKHFIRSSDCRISQPQNLGESSTAAEAGGWQTTRGCGAQTRQGPCLRPTSRVVQNAVTVLAL
jgi:hypothetical protein